MSETGPTRPEQFMSRDQAALMASFLREWALLREQETDLLRRIAAVLAPPPGGGHATDPVQDNPADETWPGGDPSDALPEACPDDPAWIDRTIDAVLAGAFSAEPEPEVDDQPAVDLLLLRSGDTWIGMPWDSVTRLGLADDVQPAAPGAPASLREILGMSGSEAGGEDVAEPYCLTWDTALGPRALACEVLGGVLAAPAAAARGVDLVWLPEDSPRGGLLLPLVEFLATNRRGGSGKAVAESGRVEDAASANLSQAPYADQAMAGSPRASARPLPGAQPVAEPVSFPSMASRRPEEERPPAEPVTFPSMASRRPEVERSAAPRPARHPSCSALVSVRYLPARVAIVRALRSRGWFVLETADTAELPAMLQRVHHRAVFAEAPERSEPGWIEELQRARQSGTRVICVASRLRGAAGDPLRVLGEVPQLSYPFQEAELERLIEPPPEA
jgi:hypothetical protein